jgi:hypothetical protein
MTMDDESQVIAQSPLFFDQVSKKLYDTVLAYFNYHVFLMTL